MDELTVKQKQIAMIVVMLLAVAILAYFVKVELSNQERLLDLLSTCDYDQICKSCYNPIKW